MQSFSQSTTRPNNVAAKASGPLTSCAALAALPVGVELAALVPDAEPDAVEDAAASAAEIDWVLTAEVADTDAVAVPSSTVKYVPAMGCPRLELCEKHQRWNG